MSEIDDLKNSVRKEIEDLDEFLKRAKDISDITPLVQERKQEAEAKYLTLNQMPEEQLAELASKLLPIQQKDQANLEAHLPSLPMINKGVTQHYLVSGSASAFYDTAVSYARYSGEVPAWSNHINQVFGSLAEEKTRKTALPLALNELQQDLGEEFTSAIDSAEKAKGRIIGIDHAAMRMRDVIEHAWGGLAEITRRKCENTKGNQRLELKKQSHRTLVANCLAETESRGKLVLLLDNMYGLWEELSPISKDPLSSDMDRLKILYSRWLLELDDLLKLVTP